MMRFRWILAAVFGLGLLNVFVPLALAFSVLREEPALESAYFLSHIMLPVLVAGSAALVIWQIADVRLTMKMDQFGATGDRMVELTRLMVEYPELYPFFYEGRDLKRVRIDLERRVYAVAEYWLDVFDGELLRLSLFSTVMPNTPSLREWMVDCFRRSPALCEVLERSGGLYREELHKIAAEGIAARVLV